MTIMTAAIMESAATVGFRLSGRASTLIPIIQCLKHPPKQRPWQQCFPYSARSGLHNDSENPEPVSSNLKARVGVSTRRPPCKLNASPANCVEIKKSLKRTRL